MNLAWAAPDYCLLALPQQSSVAQSTLTVCALPCQALTKGGRRGGSPERSDPLGASELREGGVGTVLAAGSTWGGAWELLPGDQLGPVCLEHPCKL